MTLKFLSFWHIDFWKMIIFKLHQQYAYQMKSEIILNSYLLPKSIIAIENFWKKLDFKIFCLNFQRKQNFNQKLSKKIFTTLQFLFLIISLNNKNGNYMKVWLSWPHQGRNGKQSKLVWADSSPPDLMNKCSFTKNAVFSMHFYCKYL